MVILGVALCAVVAGARSFTAIAEWAADTHQQTLNALGVTGRVPSESSFRNGLRDHLAEASPAELAVIFRGHWLIEDRLHWVRSPGVSSL
jgi:DDE_Tnp_1-associated